MPTKRGGGRGEDRGGKKGMKSGNPRHISIEKREEIQKPMWLNSQKRQRWVDIGFQPDNLLSYETYRSGG